MQYFLFALSMSSNFVSFLSEIFKQGMIHLVSTQYFPKNQHFLPPDMHTYQGVRNVKFSEDFAYVLNEWSPGICRR